MMSYVRYVFAIGLLCGCGSDTALPSVDGNDPSDATAVDGATSTDVVDAVDEADTASSGCTTSDDCAPGEYCNFEFEDGRCLLAGLETCRRGWWCPIGTYCEDEVCVPGCNEQSLQGCCDLPIGPDGGPPYDGSDDRPMPITIPCPEHDAVCIDGETCVIRENCEVDDDCPGDYVCQSSECALAILSEVPDPPACYCGVTDSCPSGDCCEGRCTPCISHQDCGHPGSGARCDEASGECYQR